ncbi:SoxR reducing system RseC family protein [Marilutibacter chinensis]|uniref:SoxR reducing system RseC family protein n=1 Tax=Marilutibacter chinensis TaxID=2912247 RepID=A0ABS9HU78_9GAMM|nr:SoxR reducing system RseC family protein [Lysobacter chinensis]MCF7221720.1 SoxR reducing system RseC family protein [Lysobacter chinensis]
MTRRQNIPDVVPDAAPDPGGSARDALAAEAGRQAAAERPGPGDPVEDRYRAVYHAVRTAPLPDPLPTFALQMERLTRDHRERAGTEAWLGYLLPVLAFVAIAVWGGGAVIEGLEAGLAHWRGAPWPMLAAAGIGIGVAWLLDRMLRQRWRIPTGGHRFGG